MRQHAAALAVVGLATVSAAVGAEFSGASDWQGFYVGAQVGAVYGVTSGVSSDFLDEDLYMLGHSPAIYAGVNASSGNLVYGLEADVGSGKVLGDARFFESTIAGDAGSMTMGIDWTAHVRGRVGIANSDLLVYLSGGFASAKATGDAVFDSHFDPEACTVDYILYLCDLDPTSDSVIYHGYTIGLGLEAKLSSNIVARFEYSYDDYGSKPLIYYLSYPYGAKVANDFHLASHNVRVGVAAGMFEGPALGTDLSAQDAMNSGSLYLFATAGLAMPNELDATRAGVEPDEVNVIIGLENGYSGSAGAGFDLGGGLKVEAELGYFDVGTVNITVPDLTPDPISDDAPGTVTGMFAMANLWYALPTGDIRPFIGGGLGGASLTIDAGPYFGGQSVDDTSTALAWQVGAGIEADFGSNIEFLLRYRYLSTDNFVVQDSDLTDVAASFSASMLDAGVRVHF